MEEIWKNIPGYEGYYQASSEGRIRSLDRAVRCKGGSTSIRKGKILNQQIDKDGYPFVRFQVNLAVKIFFVYRLVWMAFNGPIPEGMQCNHINEIKTDCRLENLNLMTPKENINWGTGIRRRKKPVVQLLPDGTEFRSFFSAMDAEKELGISHSNISSCCNGKYKSAGGFRWRYAE